MTFRPWLCTHPGRGYRVTSSFSSQSLDALYPVQSLELIVACHNFKGGQAGHWSSSAAFPVQGFLPPLFKELLEFGMINIR